MDEQKEKRQDKSNINKKTSKKIDSISLALTFIGFGVLLAIYPDFFGNEHIAVVVQWVFIMLGAIGFFFSFGDANFRLQGMSDIGTGVIVLTLAFIVFYFVPKPWSGIAALIIALIGAFGLIRGILSVVVATWIAFKMGKEKGESSGSRVFIVIEALTKMGALSTVIIQIIKLFI